MTTLNFQQQLEYFADPYTAEIGAKWLRKLKHIELRDITLDARTLKYFREVKGVDSEDTKGLGYFVDGKQLTMRDVGHICQSVGSHYGVTHGLRIIEVSKAECELYRRTDLHAVSPKEWTQSFPLILVKLPPDLFPKLIGVVSLPQLNYFCNLFTFPAHGVIDHCYIGDNFEDALTHGDGEPAQIPLEIGRIAVNACLNLANYPDLYGRFSCAQNQVRIRKPDSFGRPKRFDLIPQTIRLNVPPNVEALHEHIGEQSGKRPHWRRGHWRRVAIGAGRNGRKHVWIKPVMVNSKWLADGEHRNDSVYLD